MQSVEASSELVLDGSQYSVGEVYHLQQEESDDGKDDGSGSDDKEDSSAATLSALAGAALSVSTFLF